MPKIQNVAIGSYIRNPQGRRLSGANVIEVMQVARNDGNTFLCYPVVGKASGKVSLDTTRYLQIAIDTQVELASP